MKWFKHYTDSSDDEFIAGLEEKFGLIGYARWWKLLETIAKAKWTKQIAVMQNILGTNGKHS